MLEFFEDGQGVLPGLAGGLGITSGLLSLTQLDEGVCLVAEVTEFLVKREQIPPARRSAKRGSRCSRC